MDFCLGERGGGGASADGGYEDFDGVLFVTDVAVSVLNLEVDEVAGFEVGGFPEILTELDTCLTVCALALLPEAFFEGDFFFFFDLGGGDTEVGIGGDSDIGFGWDGGGELFFKLLGIIVMDGIGSVDLEDTVAGFWGAEFGGKFCLEEAFAGGARFEFE